MADIKQFGLKGVGDDVQIGKKGPRVKSSGGEVFFRGEDDQFYVNVHGADPTENSHFATKGFVDSQVGAITEGQRFYINDLLDVTVPAPADQDVLTFDTASGEWINQRVDALFRQQILGIAKSQNIGAVVPSNAIIDRVKVKITTAYDTGVTLDINDNTRSYMTAGENDPEVVSTYLSELLDENVVGGTQLVADFYGPTPTVGVAVAQVHYRLS